MGNKQTYGFDKGDMVRIVGTDCILKVSKHWLGDDDVILESPNGQLITIDYKGVDLAEESLRSVETKPESVIGKCIDKPIKDEALTAEDGERLANEHVENYLTMNGRPVHRPDVLKHSFLAGYRSRDGEVQALKAEIAVLRMNAEMEALSNTRSIFGGQEIVQRNIKLTSKLERMESLVRKAVDFSRRANAGETQDCDGYSMLHYYDKVWVPDASQALKDEESRE